MLQQRQQQFVLPTLRASLAIAAEMLDRANPVDIRGQRVEVERQPLERPIGLHVQNLFDIAIVVGKVAIAGDLKADGAGQAHGGAGDQRDRARARHYLKSRREKMSVAAIRRTAMYSAP